MKETVDTMNEKFGGPKAEIPAVVTPEEQERQDDEYLKLFRQDHPEAIVTPDAKREGEAEIAEFESLVDAFEAKHPLEALMAITDLEPEDAPFHPIREPARLDLSAIFALKKKIEKETKLSAEQAAILKARWKRISQAVGVINNKKVDHTR